MTLEFTEEYPDGYIPEDAYKQHINNLELENKEYKVIRDAMVAYKELLKQRIVKLESPKTCEGCRYEMFYGSDNCTNCIRAKFVWDNYEPKKDTE